MIYPLTLWSQNVLIEIFWSEMNFPKRITNSFQTSWNKLAKFITLTSQTLYIYSTKKVKEIVFERLWQKV